MKKALFLLAFLCETSFAAPFIDAIRAGEDKTIVLYGTSLTAMYSPVVYPGSETYHWTVQFAVEVSALGSGYVNVINSGQGAIDSNWGVTNFPDRVAAHSPDVLIMEFSINSCFFKIGTEKERINTLWMISEAKAAGATEIYLQIMNSPSFALYAAHADLQLYHDVYREIASQDPQVYLLDHDPAWDSIVALGSDEYHLRIPDDSHPVELGFNEVTMPNLRTMLGFSAAPVIPREDLETAFEAATRKTRVRNAWNSFSW